MPYITVYSKIPSLQSFSNKSILHSFIQLNHDIKQVYGFYNKAGITDGKPGQILDDSWRVETGDYQAKKDIFVTEEQYNRIVERINASIEHSGNYDIRAFLTPDPNDIECTMWVNNLLTDSGVKTELTKFQTPIGQYFWMKYSDNPLLSAEQLKSIEDDWIRHYNIQKENGNQEHQYDQLPESFVKDFMSSVNNHISDKLAESLIPKTSTMLAGSDDSYGDQAVVEAWQNAQARTELVSTLKSILDEEQDTQIINVHPSEDNTVTFTFDNGRTYAVHSDSSYDYARQDGNGDIVSGHVNADGSWMEQVSTADGTPVSSQAVNTDGSWTANTYDPNGYLIKQVTTDQDGNVTDTTYDAQEAAARAAYEQALKDTAPIGYAATLGEALANGDGLGAAAAAIHMLNYERAIEAIVGKESAPSYVAGLGAVAAGLDLIHSIQNENYLGAASSGVNLLKDIGTLAGLKPTDGLMNGLGAVGGVLSAISAIQGLTSDDALTQIQSAGNLVVALDNTYKGVTGLMGTSSGFLTPGVAAGIGLVTSAISMVQAFESGNPAAIVSSMANVALAGYTTAVALEYGILQASLCTFNPYVIAAAIVITLISTLVGGMFGDDDEETPPPPPPEGEAHFVRYEDGSIGISVEGKYGGVEILQAKMTELLADLRQQAEAAGLEIVPERLPSLTLAGWPSFIGNNYIYVMKLADPVTGETRMLAAPIADTADKFMGASSYAEGFVEEWEAKQIEMRRENGDPNYAETEGQYAHRLSRQAAGEAETDAGHQALTALVVDLAGDGVPKIALPESVARTLTALLSDGVARFDADDDGYKEATEWITGRDAFLAIDRDGSGTIDNARELLSGMNVAADIRGRELLSFFDANHDGVLDRNDPAFLALKLWLDVNGDGTSDVREVFGLADLGIERIELNGLSDEDILLRFAEGEGLRAEEITLEAEKDGAAVWQDERSGNIVVNAENGLDGKGADARLNYVVDADDLAELQKLFDPEADLSEEERERLIALAREYNLDPEAPDFEQTVKSLRVRGTAPASSAPIYLEDGSVDSDEDPLAGGTKTQRTIQRILSAASEDASLLFSGTGAALTALAIGAGAIPLEEAEAAPTEAPTDTMQPSAAVTTPVQADELSVLASTDTIKAPPYETIVITSEDVFSLPETDSIATSPDEENLLYPDRQAAGEIESREESDPFPKPAATEAAAGSTIQQPSEDASDAGRGGIDFPENSLPDSPPVAMDDPIRAEEDVALLLTPQDLLGNDYNPDPDRILRIIEIGKADHGMASLNPDGTVLFVPDRDYHGPASFTYIISDDAGGISKGTVNIEVGAVNDNPTVVDEYIPAGVEDTALLIDPALLLQNDSDVDIVTGDGDVLSVASVGNAVHGTVRMVEGRVEFIPDTDFNGLASFDYTVSDGMGGRTTGTTSIRIAAVNDAPIGVGERIEIDEDTIAVIPQSVLLANEIDPDIATNGDTLKIISFSNASHGTVFFNDENEVVFVPDANYHGTAGFDYTVWDAAGAETTAHTTVDIASVNDAPVAVGETFHGGLANAVVYIPISAVLQNDYDVDGDPVRLTGILSTEHGEALMDWENQRIVFTPEKDFTGTAGFRYQITDDHGGVAEATMDIRINTPPEAAADGITVLEDGGAVDYDQSWATVILPETLLANDSDVDGDNLTIRWVGNSENCTVEIQDDGTIRLTTPQNYNGPASFQYETTDGYGGTAVQSVSVNVLAVNDRPVIERVAQGFPIYCYEYKPSEIIGYRYEEFNPVPIPVYSEPSWTVIYDNEKAIQVYREGHAVAASGSEEPITPSFYRNGTLVPIAYDKDEPLLSADDELKDTLTKDFGHIVAWDPDGNSESLSYQIVASPLHGSATLGSAQGYLGYTDARYGGETDSHGKVVFWEFNPTSYDTYFGNSTFTVRVSDAEGAYADVPVTSFHYGYIPGGGKPVAIDIDRDGLEFVGVDDSNVFYDINGDGWREHIAWTDRDDGLLAFDKDGDGIIDRHDEISFTGYKEGARTDLEGLQAFDTDGDGRLTANDSDWARFGVWRDANLDGITDPGEFKSLAEMDIAAINLQSDGNISVEAEGDVTLFGTSSYEMEDGTTGNIGDAAFRYTDETMPAQEAPVVPDSSAAVESACMSDADIMRMLQQFVSDCAGEMVQPPSELCIPPSTAPLDVIIAENVLHEFMEPSAQNTVVS